MRPHFSFAPSERLTGVAQVIRLFVAYVILSVATFLMLRTIIGYTTFRDDVQFLLLKQTYIHNHVWKTAFYIHVFSAVIALLAGFTPAGKLTTRISQT